MISGKNRCRFSSVLTNTDKLLTCVLPSHCHNVHRQSVIKAFMGKPWNSKTILTHSAEIQLSALEFLKASPCTIPHQSPQANASLHGSVWGIHYGPQFIFTFAMDFFFPSLVNWSICEAVMQGEYVFLFNLTADTARTLKYRYAALGKALSFM